MSSGSNLNSVNSFNSVNSINSANSVKIANSTTISAGIFQSKRVELIGEEEEENISDDAQLIYRETTFLFAIIDFFEN